MVGTPKVAQDFRGIGGEMPSGNHVLVAVLIVLALVVAYFVVMGFLFPLFGDGP
jgi:hypothetical protein